MQNRRNFLPLKSLVFFLLALWFGWAFLADAVAQTTTVGNLSGTVRDANGAAIPKAEVLIQEERTGLARQVTANENGFFSAPSLPVGRYRVSSSPSGFKQTINSGLELHVNENLVVNLTLEVGLASETVTITGAASQLETRNGEVSSLIGEKQVTELPLNGRNYAQLALMVPGVSPATGGVGGGLFAANGTGLDAAVDISVNGNGTSNNLWTVDGVNNLDVGSNRTLLVFPAIDSILEFRVERNSYSAEFGQAQGAVINLITKSGGNQFHGTLFEFARHDRFNATDFFLKRAGQPKAALRYNNFGGNFSGPIIKNRAFFFWSEEWRRERRGVTLGAKVPTAAEKRGDFSGALTSQLPHDPLTGRPFPGNKIPANRLSPAGLALLQVYPDPNTNTPGNNWVASPLQPINTRQDSIRGDVTLTANLNLMIRYINEAWAHGAASGNFWGDSPFPTLSSDWAQPSKSFAIKLTNSLSSSSVNEFQFSRAGNDVMITTTAATAALNEEIGAKFPTVFPKPQGVGLPTFFGADGYPLLWHQAPWQNHQDLFIWKDDYAKVSGAHSLKLGALVSHNIKDVLIYGPNGLAQFCGSNTRTGNAIAELLVKDLPLACYTEINDIGQRNGRWHDFEFYLNDTWKLSRKLTLNAGLRWSRYSPTYIADNRISNYLPRLYDGKNPLSGLVQANTPGFNRALVKAYNRGYQPRLGLAWDLTGDGKMALRVGVGRFIGRSNDNEFILRLGGNPPWITTVNSHYGGSSVNLSDDPTFRSLDTINAGLKNAVAGVGSNSGFTAVSEDFRPPESWQWNASLAREVMKNTLVEISYIGNHGLHLWRRAVNFNEVIPSARPAIARAIQNNQDLTALIDANRRFKGLGPISMTESTGDSNYHALQVWVNRRFNERLAFQMSYTWSHTITNVPLASFTNTTSDPFNYNLDRGDADLDRRQMLIANAVYVLPALHRWGALANRLLGDWQVNAIATWLGGVPTDVLSGANTAGLAANASGGFRPDRVAGVPLYLHTGEPTRYLNPAAFALPAAGQFGNLGRGSIRLPGVKNFDLSVVKNWKLGERYGVQLRSEMFNVFNHANFNGLDNNLSFDNTATLPDPNNPSRRVANPNFGKPINSRFGLLNGDLGPRVIQFGFKFNF
ncbi:MAG: carboxypeptidase regulatory-like domain-containing protein [Acidobacteria bacterium]|nr:carboxypeptidase regulatory-like domain-containing protein [Acidobacteriota bacterium]